MKTFTKHILLLALMLFGVAGAAWADRAPQKFTSAVNLSVLQVGDTLAEGASITFDIGSPSWDRTMNVAYNRAKKNGFLVTDFYGEEINIGSTIGAGGVIINGNDSFTPVTQSDDDGDAWVVTYRNVDGENDVIDIEISGILLPAPASDPYAPALDELTGNWNFLMPGSNKVVKAVLLDSIVVGPHVSVEGLAIEGKYANGTDTVYYYDTNSHSSITLRAAANDGQGRNFGYWADLDPTDPEYSSWYRYISSGRFTCGDTFRAVYPDNHTLTLVTPQGGGTLELDGVTYDTVYNITFYHISTPEGSRTFTIPASRLPYDTTFHYNANISMVQLDEQPGKLRKIQVEQSVTIRIEGAFEDYGFYSCQLEGGGDDEWVITCTAGTQPKMPYGITKTGNGTYSVMEGLTVSVTATPDSAHYLSAIGNEAVISNSAYNISFTMPDDDAELAATFTTKPTLTLAQTDGGTLEAIVPQGEPVLLTTIIPSSNALITNSQTNDTVTVTVAGDLQWGGGGWKVQEGNGNHGSVTVTAEAGFDIAYYKFYFSNGSCILSEEAAAVYPFYSATSSLPALLIHII